MKIGVKVGDIMTRDFVSVKPDTSIKDCAKIMLKKRVGSLVVKENNKLKGMITERDIIWAMTKKSLHELKKIKAFDLAKKKIFTIKPSADLYEALEKMKKSKYRWLPVTLDKNVIGFLTLKDILAIEPSLFEIARNYGAFQIRDEEEKIMRIKTAKRGKSWNNEGMCEECGNFEMLYNLDGRLICESCREAF